MDWNSDMNAAPRDGSWFVTIQQGYPDSFEVGKYEPLTHDQYEHVEGDLYRKKEAKLYDWRGFNNFSRATHWAPLDPPNVENPKAT